MSRHLQKLKKENQKENNFAVIDIETMKWTKFLVLGYYDGLTFTEFRKPKSFFKFLEAQNIDTIFAHFAGKFDFLFILQWAFEHKIEIENIIPRGATILCLTLKINNKKYNFRDSSALLPFSLKSITDNFKTSTRKGEWDHSKTKGYSKELAAYLKADCISLHESLTAFFNWPLIKKSGPSITIASQSLRVFRTFLKNDLANPGKFINNFARKAYFGGRVEIFKPYCKKGPIYEYDVNSLYPFVMKESFFPIGRGVLTFKYQTKFLGIYDCIVTTPKLHIPCLGIIHDKKYIFPVGQFRGRFTNIEIDYARSLGYKIETKNGIYFPQKEKIFTDYIAELHAIKNYADEDSVNYILAKLLMNSLYGRFALNLNRENISLDLQLGAKEFREIKLKGKSIMLYKVPVELESYTHVAISSFVTSYARVHMHKLMNPIAQSVYYSDTDSIFTTSQLKTGNELGQLKLKRTEDSAIFLLPKTYITLNKNSKNIKMKGFSSKKTNDFTFEDFKNALEGDLKRFKIVNEPKFATLKQALAKNKIVTMTKQSEKQLKALYNKRIIYKNSSGDILTKPITLMGE